MLLCVLTQTQDTFLYICLSSKNEAPKLHKNANSRFLLTRFMHANTTYVSMVLHLFHIISHRINDISWCAWMFQGLKLSYLKFLPLHPSFAIMADRQQSLITTERVKLDGEIPIHQNNLISKVDLSTKLTWWNLLPFGSNISTRDPTGPRWIQCYGFQMFFQGVRTSAPLQTSTFRNDLMIFSTKLWPTFAKFWSTFGYHFD